MMRGAVFAALSFHLCWAAPAAAQSCTFSMEDMDFGTVDPTLNQNIDISRSLAVSCTAIPTNRQIRICLHICQGSGGMDAGASTRYMVNGAQQLQFNIYRTTVSNGVWGARGNAGDSLCGSGWSSLDLVHQILSSPDSSGNFSTTVTAFGRIFAGQTTLPAGTYISSFAAGAPSRAVAVYQLSTGQNCGQITANATDFPFTATATVAPSCRVTAGNLDFGTQSLLTGAAEATSSISVTCTAGQSYAVGLSQGTTAGGTTTTRLMAHAGSGATVPYQLFADPARTQNWGNSLADDVEGTGTGGAVAHTVYGRIPAQPSAPAAGDYSDTVTVTVTY
jgi:spore coat protein U-like protein